MKFYRLCFVVILFSLLGGCGSFLNARVTQFHELDQQPRKFAIVPTPEQADSLEFRSYASLLSQQLVARGWSLASFDDADVGVFLIYAIGQGRQVLSSAPVFGNVPTGTSYTTGSVSTYGDTSNFNATTTQGSTFGIVGSQTVSRTEFDRTVQLKMFSLAEYRKSKAMVPVYDGSVKSTGKTGEMAPLMPTLIRSLFEDFPGKSGSSRDTTLQIGK